MKLFGLPLVLSLLSLVSNAAATFVGNYSLVQVQDAMGNNVAIPEHPEGEEYTLTISAKENQDNAYHMSLKVYNVIGGDFYVTDGNLVSWDPLVTTSMQAPSSIMELELTLLLMIEETNQIDNTGNSLELTGGKGTIVFQPMKDLVLEKMDMVETSQQGLFHWDLQLVEVIDKSGQSVVIPETNELQNTLTIDSNDLRSFNLVLKLYNIFRAQIIQKNGKLVYMSPISSTFKVSSEGVQEFETAVIAILGETETLQMESGGRVGQLSGPEGLVVFK